MIYLKLLNCFRFFRTRSVRPHARDGRSVIMSELRHIEIFIKQKGNPPHINAPRYVAKSLETHKISHTNLAKTNKDQY